MTCSTILTALTWHKIYMYTFPGAQLGNHSFAFYARYLQRKIWKSWTGIICTVRVGRAATQLAIRLYLCRIFLCALLSLASLQIDMKKESRIDKIIICNEAKSIIILCLFIYNIITAFLWLKRSEMYVNLNKPAKT